jgi:hypothetical protein
MRKLFITFNGDKEDELGRVRIRANSGRNERVHTLDDLGKEVIYSSSINYNRLCQTANRHYGVHVLSESADPYALLKECAVFAAEYPEIGFVMFDDRDANISSTLAERVYTNAYSGIESMNYFYIMFNARPRPCNCYGRKLTFGYDHYSVVYDPGSIIVWNLEHFADYCDGEYQLWGICQNTNSGLSATDDVLTSIRRGVQTFALH